MRYGVVLRIGDKDREFVAMQSGSQVHGADTANDHLGRQLDHFIANLMTIIVVDRFKMITIQHDQYAGIRFLHVLDLFRYILTEGFKIHRAG